MCVAAVAPDHITHNVRAILNVTFTRIRYPAMPLRATQLPLSLPGVGFPPMVTDTWLGAARELYQKIQQANRFVAAARVVHRRPPIMSRNDHGAHDRQSRPWRFHAGPRGLNR